VDLPKGHAPGSSFEPWYALVRLCDARLRELGPFRLARILGPVVAIASAVPMVLVHLAHQEDAVVALVMQGAGSLSWLVGTTAGLAVAADMAARDVDEGIEGLVLRRGLTESGLARARFAASAARMAWLVGVPALLLALLCVVMAPSWLALAKRAALCVEVIGYSALVGIVVAAVARGASALLPSHGRLLFAAVVLLPHVAHELDHGIPSIPGALEDLREQLLEVALE
jgi:hypothetical protein